MIETLNNDFTKEDLLEIDKKIKLIPLTFDLMFKSLFENNLDALKRFLISVLHLDIEPEDCNIKINNEALPLSHYKEYKKTIDILVVINDIITINIEMNQTNFNKIKRRNYIYHNKIGSLSLKSGDKIEKLKEYQNIQLNLNAIDKSNNIGEDIIVPYSLKTESIYIENDIIYLRYLDYYNKLYYNKNIQKDESDLWLAALTSKTLSELNDILCKFLDDEMRQKIIKDVVRMSYEGPILDEYERKRLDEIFEYDSKMIDRKEAREEGHAEGLAEGREETIKDTIKAMLGKKISYEDISDITGKSISEIKKIEKSIKE